MSRDDPAIATLGVGSTGQAIQYYAICLHSSDPLSYSAWGAGNIRRVIIIADALRIGHFIITPAPGPLLHFSDLVSGDKMGIRQDAWDQDGHDGH